MSVFVAASTSHAAGLDGKPPIVFNASGSVRAGDLIGLQGTNFGTKPRVFLESAPDVPLAIVNSIDTTWLAVRLPATARGALHLRVANASGTSARVRLNGARPLHLDAMQLVAGGAFRVFGRALASEGKVPTVTIDGLPATVDRSRTDEYMITATAPATLRATAAATILVDNGNGSGAAKLDRVVDVVGPTGAGGDPFALGVGWGAGFATLARSTVDPATDRRLRARLACDGRRDDTATIQSAIDLAAVRGGVVRLPAGRCRIAGSLQLRSRVVVQGAGKTATELVYEADYPVSGTRLDLAGLAQLTLSNAGPATEGPMLKDSTRVFLKDVRVRLMKSRQMYLSGNRNFAVVGCDFDQAGSLSGQGPYVFNDSAGLLFEGNTTRWVGGAPTFGHIHDSYVHRNRFTRDGRVQNEGGSTVHSFAMDFAHRIAVVGNTFDVADGPITNKTRNDGETILTEGGGAARTENIGTVVNATRDTLSDPSNTFNLDPFGTGTLPENYGVAIVSGAGAGQTRRLVAADGSTLTVDRPWDVVPSAGSHYATGVWGLEKTVVKDNVLSQNPRGIWLYHTAVRDVDIVGNRISEGGGIYLRAYQNLATKSFSPLYNVVIARNTIANTTGQWMSYVNAVFVNADARAFGIALLGIDIRSNTITANRPNVTSNREEYAGTEGFANVMRVENYAGYERSDTPRVLGSILVDNTCVYCDVAVRVGTGAGGTTIVDHRLVHGGSMSADWATTSTREQSVRTVIR